MYFYVSSKLRKQWNPYDHLTNAATLLLRFKQKLSQSFLESKEPLYMATPFICPDFCGLLAWVSLTFSAGGQQLFTGRLYMFIMCIIAELNGKNSQIFTKVQRCGIHFLLKLLLCQVFPILRKTARIFSKIIPDLAKAHTGALAMQPYCYVRGGLNYKPGGF